MDGKRPSQKRINFVKMKKNLNRYFPRNFFFCEGYGQVKKKESVMFLNFYNAE